MCTPVKGDDCVICAHPIEGQPRIPLTGCGHDCFHDKCLARWLRTQRSKGIDETCPICRADVEMDYTTIVSHPRRNTFAIIEGGGVTYYAGKHLVHHEKLPTKIADLQADLVAQIGSLPLVIRRHSFVRMNSAIICRADTPSQLTNSLNYFLMSRFKTRRQRARVIAQFTPGTEPFMLTAGLHRYRPKQSLANFWGIDSRPVNSS